MKSGELNRRVTILKPVENTRSGSGEVPVTYVPDTSFSSDGKVWAKVSALIGKRFFDAMQTQSTMTHEIRVRFREGYRTTHRISHEAERGKFQTLSIDAVQPVSDDKTRLSLMCTLRESDGWR